MIRIIQVIFSNIRARVPTIAILIAACTSGAPDYDDDDWLLSNDACPVDILPAESAPTPSMLIPCDNRAEQCWASCWHGHGEDCYLLALLEQKVSMLNPRSEALFLRSCQLGIDSGCTNRASGIYQAALEEEQGREERLTCANATFEQVCRRGDPWACTMYGANLTRGIGLDIDYVRAIEVLPKACVLGPEDPACKAANEIAAEARRGLGETSQ